MAYKVLRILNKDEKDTLMINHKERKNGLNIINICGSRNEKIINYKNKQFYLKKK